MPRSRRRDSPRTATRSRAGLSTTGLFFGGMCVRWGKVPRSVRPPLAWLPVKDTYTSQPPFHHAPFRCSRRINHATPASSTVHATCVLRIRARGLDGARTRLPPPPTPPSSTPSSSTAAALLLPPPPFVGLSKAAPAPLAAARRARTASAPPILAAACLPLAAAPEPNARARLLAPFWQAPQQPAAPPLLGSGQARQGCVRLRVCVAWS